MITNKKTCFISYQFLQNETVLNLFHKYHTLRFNPSILLPNNPVAPRDHADKPNFQFPIWNSFPNRWEKFPTSGYCFAPTSAQVVTRYQTPIIRVLWFRSNGVFRRQQGRQCGCTDKVNQCRHCCDTTGRMPLCGSSKQCLLMRGISQNCPKWTSAATIATMLILQVVWNKDETHVGEDYRGW